MTEYHDVLLVMALPGLPTALALRSMRLFVDEIAPALTQPRSVPVAVKGEQG